MFEKEGEPPQNDQEDIVGVGAQKVLRKHEVVNEQRLFQVLRL